jgi:hypothetical protein
VLASHDRSKLELAGHDLKTMAPGDWLNDECMNMYIALLQVRECAVVARTRIQGERGQRGWGGGWGTDREEGAGSQTVA